MKVKVKAYLMCTQNEWQDAPQFAFWPSDVSSVSLEHALVGVHELEVDVPDDFDPIPGRIDTLRKKKQEILAEAQAKANNIEDQIQRLLSLEYKPGEEADMLRDHPGRMTP